MSQMRSSKAKRALAKACWVQKKASSGKDEVGVSFVSDVRRHFALTGMRLHLEILLLFYLSGVISISLCF